MKKRPVYSLGVAETKKKSGWKHFILKNGKQVYETWSTYRTAPKRLRTWVEQLNAR